MKVLLYCLDENVDNNLLKHLKNCTELECECIFDKDKFIDLIYTERIYLAIVTLKNNDYIEIINSIKARGIGTVIYLLGDNDEESVNVYRYRCDGFINTGNLDNDMMYLLDNFWLLYKRIHRLKAVTFGRFDLFVDDERMELRNKKAKELLALCIDKCGGHVSLEEATDKLWYGRPYDERVKCLYRKAVMELNAFFREKGIDNVFVTGRGYCCIKKESLDCDYYRFIENPQKECILYNGEYMFEYSWSEETLSKIEVLYSNICDKLLHKNE